MASSVETAAPSLPAVVLQESEPTVLEDFILQAEIYLQYGMRSKALERLERVSKLFPHEGQKNEKLRRLYISAGFAPVYETAPVKTAAPAPAPAPPPQTQGKTTNPSPATPASPYQENSVDSFPRLTEITRNLYRHASVKN